MSAAPAPLGAVLHLAARAERRRAAAWADTPPRRAHVALVHDPNPHAAPSVGEELPLRGGLPGSVLRRVVFLAVLTAIVMLLG